MDQEPRDEFASPLDEVFQNLPEEEPPPDLQQRCLEVLTPQQTQPRPGRQPRVSWLRPALTAAAALVVMVGLTSVMMTVVAPGKMSRMSQALAPPPQGAPDLGVPLYPAPGGPGAGPAGIAPPSATGGSRSDAGVPAAGATLQVGTRIEERAAVSAEPPMSREAEAKPADAYDTAVRQVPATPSPPVDSLAGDSAAPQKPWRDQSRQRQRIVSKEMAVEVDDIERAHEQATGIIEKSGGYVDSEDLQISEDQRSYAHLQARVPVASLDGVVAQLRRLGHVKRLSGNSEDRTAEYVNQGGAIRSDAEREAELVARYEAERNKQRKRQLYAEIMALRENRKTEKQQLLGLSKETHYATLDLTLNEINSGVRRFLKRLGDNALQVTMWVGATAIIWLPLLVIGIVLWRRQNRLAG
jgi:hypothetical protein